jgi:small-conductance mechanosensitive channel
VALIILIFLTASAQTEESVRQELGTAIPDIAPVKVDGRTLFFVRGVSSYSAAKRASAIGERISDAAANYRVHPDSVRAVPENEYLKVIAGSEFIMNIYDVDGEWEQVEKSVLAIVITEKVKGAIRDYRQDRSGPTLMRNSAYAIGALALLFLLLIILNRLFRKLSSVLETRYQVRVREIEKQAFKLISAEQFWKTIHALMKTVKIILFIVIIVVFLNYIFSLYPWTNTVTAFVLQIFTKPIISFAQGVVGFLPSLAFLIILFIVTRYLLKLTQLLFRGLEQGGFHIKGFDPEWAMPTFRIVRLILIVFAVVIAYPYIPGSDTNAFKGISVFAGVLLSLGSSSFIGNVIAGYSMTYRRAFRHGDRIKVGEHTGFVEEQKLLVTRLRSFKNEEIVIPNSELLNSSIINYTTKAKDPGLILHTQVGIGYETPWRLVDAMLKEAADRTGGLLKEPKPYVLKHALGDFAVTYEINGFCNDVRRMHLVYTELHQHILDVFNENNVQIMTPAYEGDPEIPKVVPRELWDLQPAKTSQKANDGKDR